MHSCVTFKLLLTVIVWSFYSNGPVIIGHKCIRHVRCKCDASMAPSGGVKFNSFNNCYCQVIVFQTKMSCTQMKKTKFDWGFIFHVYTCLRSDSLRFKPWWRNNQPIGSNIIQPWGTKTKHKNLPIRIIYVQNIHSELYTLLHTNTHTCTAVNDTLLRSSEMK